MIIRIVRRPPVDTIDGFRLDRFEVGGRYEVGTSLGALLLSEQWAEPVTAEPAEHAPLTTSEPAQPPPAAVTLPINDDIVPPNLIREIYAPSVEAPGTAGDAPKRRRRD